MTERLPEATVFEDEEEKSYLNELIRVLRIILDIFEADIALVTPGAIVSTSASTYTISSEDTLSCTATCTVTLPSDPIVGQKHNIRHNSSSGILTLDGNGNNINGSSLITMNIQYIVRTIQYDGTEWMII